MNAGSTTVILGGGFGGIVAARALRAALPAPHRILLVTKDRSFRMGTTKTWVMLGQADPEKVGRPLDGLAAGGIELVHAEVQRIDPVKRTVATADGVLAADYLVIALGADLNPSLVPGLAEGAETFYTREGAVRLRGRLQAFAGGQIVLLIPRTPFKCPPGPYEAAMMLHSQLRERGLGARTKIDVYTVEKAPMATAGPEIGRYIIDRLGEREIGFHPLTKVGRVEGDRRAVVLEDGTSIPYDLLIAIPPHEAPKAVRESGLTGSGGWIPVDSRTLQLSAGEENRVFAIGDVSSVPLPGRFAPDVPLVLPKAGVFAEAQAKVVANRIATHVLGRAPEGEFDGVGFCYIELGGDAAIRGDGSFFDLPHPSMTPSEPSAGQLELKKAWVQSWMATYL